MAKPAAGKTHKTDDDLYQYLTEDDFYDYLFLKYQVEDPEGNFIEEFNRKMAEGGITVNEAYVEQIEQTGKQVPGVDLRTGEYGLSYAAAGFFSAACLFQNRSEWDKVIANCDKTIELMPRYLFAYSIKAQAHFAKEEYLLAVEAMENAVRHNPVAIAKKKKLEAEALEIYGKGLLEELTELLVHAYYIQGRSYNRAEMYDKAIFALDRALELNPELFAALEIRVAACMESEHWRKAKNDCDKLIGSHYQEVMYLQYRGMCCRELGWYKKSIADFNAAIDMDPTLDLAYAQRAVTYFENAYFLEARADADEAIKRGVEDAYYYRARANLYIGDYDDAIADFDVLLPFWPDTENIVYLRNTAEDYKKRGMISYSRSPDGKHRDNSKKADQRR